MTHSTSVITNVPDGTRYFSVTIPTPSNTSKAMWIFQDLRNAWEFVQGNTSPAIDPGSVTARWEFGEGSLFPCVGSCFYAGPGGPYVFIGDTYSNSSDVVIHETGHNYMYNATGWWLWWDIGCYYHSLFGQEDTRCAWSEGWADFFPLAANPVDTCFDFGIGPCGFGGGAYENIEARNRNDNPPSYPWGDTVEGRVAGALYDLFDGSNDGFDSMAFGFDPVWDIIYDGSAEDNFSQFWDSWKTGGQNKHHAVRSIYQNTIDYDTPPRFDPVPPDRTVLQGYSGAHFIDLWAYTADTESADSELTYQVTYISDSRCGISLDNHWINLAPQANWLGFCDVTVVVNDSLKTASDTFRISIQPVLNHVYQPNVTKWFSR